ncbi:MAG: hypothetical protein RIT02_285, partial [Planctomycetota bacterium]
MKFHRRTLLTLAGTFLPPFSALHGRSL